MLSILIKCIRNTVIICFIVVGTYCLINFLMNTEIIRGTIAYHYELPGNIRIPFEELDSGLDQDIIIKDQRRGLYVANISLNELNRRFHNEIKWGDSVWLMAKVCNKEIYPVEILEVYWIGKWKEK